MKRYQDGFSAVEALLALIVVGALVGVGAYVYKIQKDSKTESSDSQQAASKDTKSSKASKGQDTNSSISTDGTKLVSLNRKFEIVVPDGWTAKNDTTEDYVSIIGLENMTYKAGTPAVVLNEEGFRGEGPRVANFIIQYAATDSLKGYFTGSTSLGAFVTTGGLGGTAYKYDGTGEMADAERGSTTCGYKFDKDGKTVIVQYFKAPSDPDQKSYVDAAVKSLVLL